MPAPRRPGYGPPGWPRFGRRSLATPAIGGLASPPVNIPLLWLSQPLSHRLDQVYNETGVTQSGADIGAESRGRNLASIAEIGSSPFTASLATATAADPAALSSWTLNYRGDFRVRSPQLTVNFLYRTDAERQLLLSVQRNRRIRITGVPPEYPEGADSLVVTGISHTIGVATRLIHFTTRSVIGTTPGVPGPWFRVGSSAVGGSDIVPF